jgi:glycosyltransferase involved in cell wall biosynthesis
MDRLRSKKPDVSLLLLGRMDPPGLESKMRDFIRERRLEQHVHIQGPVPYTEVSDFYLKSRIGLLLWDPIDALMIKLPIKLFEYMAFGLPIIGSDFGHIGDYLAKDSCGIPVPPEREEEVVEAIYGLLTNEKLYQKLSRNAVEKSHRDYRWEKEFEKLTGFYEKALHERS